MVKRSKKPAFSRCVCSCADEQGSALVPATSFVPREARHVSQMQFPRRSKKDPRGSSDYTAHFWVPACLPHGVTPKPAGHNPSDGADLQNFRLCSPLLIKTCGGQLLSFSQSVVLGKSFSCATPCLLLHSFFLSLSFSCSSLCNQGSFPFAAPVVLFSPKSPLRSSFLL